MKNLLSPIFFRQINSLISFVNALISRNFCQKGVRVNFRNFHTVLCAAQCVEICKVFPQDFCKNSVNLTFSLKSYTVNQFDEKFLQWGKITKLPHCVQMTETRSTFFPSNKQLLSTSIYDLVLIYVCHFHHHCHHLIVSQIWPLSRYSCLSWIPASKEFFTLISRKILSVILLYSTFVKSICYIELWWFISEKVDFTKVLSNNGDSKTSAFCIDLNNFRLSNWMKKIRC